MWKYLICFVLFCVQYDFVVGQKLNTKHKSSVKVKKEQRINVIGAYTNLVDDGEHAFGYTIEIWKYGETFCGHFLSSAGFSGDTPTGILQNIQFDKKSKKISFEAKLSTGKTWDKSDKLVPTRYLFQFRGVMTSTKLVGKLAKIDKLHTKNSIDTTKISFKLSKKYTLWMDAYKNYSAWKKHSDKILKFRGPKW